MITITSIPCKIKQQYSTSGKVKCSGTVITNTVPFSILSICEGVVVQVNTSGQETSIIIQYDNNNLLRYSGKFKSVINQGASVQKYDVIATDAKEFKFEYLTRVQNKHFNPVRLSMETYYPADNTEILNGTISLNNVFSQYTIVTDETPVPELEASDISDEFKVNNDGGDTTEYFEFG